MKPSWVTTVTPLQKEKVFTLEAEMREAAFAIKSKYDKIKVASPEAAGRAMAGIIQYLQEPLDKQHKLEELEENYSVGLIWKADYEKQKAELL
jgi:hypothetical protein